MRISATTLESFRLFMEQDWMAESDLLDTIAGKFTGNHKVWRGQAFGAVLEHPARYRVAGGYAVPPRRGCPEAFTFGDEVIGPALALIDPVRTVFEAKAIKRYGAHDVVSKADQLAGARLIETKTTDAFDFEKYAASCQWRFMADAFEPSSVTYHIFVLDEHENGVIALKAVETFNLYPYADMHLDCALLVEQFADYVRVKGLTDVLDQRQREAA